MAVTKVSGSLLWSFCDELVKSGAGYVWGGHGKIYNNAHMKALYNTYKSSKYDWKYYSETQWKRWANKIVVDCSGMIQAFRIKHLDGKDDTANGLYTKCVSKGTIDSLPKDKRGVLLFVYSKASNTMVHVGVYGGDGTTIESKDSATGVTHRALDNRWTHWGIPEWITPTTINTAKIIGGGRVICTSINVRKGPNSKNYAVAKSLSHGDVVPYYAKSGIWRKISPTEELWVSTNGSYMKPVPEYTVKAANLNVRNKPVSGNVVGVLHTNDVVYDFKPESSKESWIKIDPYNEKWVSSNAKYVEKR